jgi:thiosulfate/3-mercaptopyruvate sulfurtransferase
MKLRPPAQSNRSPFLVTTDWVEKNLDSLRIFDGTFLLPTSELNATQIYLAHHLPGAQRFDIDVIKDNTNPLPHMLPIPEQMTKYLRDLGLNEDDTIVVYDQHGISARVWWMLRIYGFENVFILEGGLSHWLDEGRATESGNELRPASDITVKLNPKLVSSMQDVQSALNRKSAQVVDARAAARFQGTAPEPRAGLRAGHMPGALNLPYNNFVEDGTLKNLDELRAILKKSGIDPAKPVISSCGSGVSAAMLCLVLASLGYDNWSLYDGSWSEWGSHEDCPVERAA